MSKNNLGTDPTYLTRYPYIDLYSENFGTNILSLLHPLLNNNTHPSIHSFSLGTKSSYGGLLLIGDAYNEKGEELRDITIRLVFRDEHSGDFRGLVNDLRSLPWVFDTTTKHSGDRLPPFEKQRGVNRADSAISRSLFPNQLQLRIATHKNKNGIFVDKTLTEVLKRIAHFWIEKGALVETKIGFTSSNLLKSLGLVPSYKLIEPDTSIDTRNESSESVDDVRQSISLDIAKHLSGYPLEATSEEFISSISATEIFNKTLQGIVDDLLVEWFWIDDSEEDTCDTLGEFVFNYLPMEICEEIISKKLSSSYILNTCNEGIDSLSIYVDPIFGRTDRSRAIQIVAYTDRERVEELITAVKFVHEGVSDKMSKKIMLDTLVIEGIDPSEKSSYDKMSPSYRDIALEKEDASAHINISFVLSPGQGLSLREMIHTIILALNAAGFKLTGGGFGFLKTGDNADGHFQSYLHEIAQKRAALRSIDPQKK